MLKLRDIMTSRVLTVAPEMNIRDAMELLAAHHVSGAPVIAGSKVVGIVSAADLLAFTAQLPGIPGFRENGDLYDGEVDLDDDASEQEANNFFVDWWQDAGADVAARYASSESPEWNRLEEHTVSEAMTPLPLCVLPSNATLKSAAECMRRESIHRVLVMDGEKLVGIVSASDIARAAADSRILQIEIKSR